jgi:hypothetical protein
MAASKRLRHTMLLRERNFNEPMMTSLGSISPSTESTSVDVQHSNLRFEKRTGFHRTSETVDSHADILAKPVTKDVNETIDDSGDDDWVKSNRKRTSKPRQYVFSYVYPGLSSRCGITTSRL